MSRPPFRGHADGSDEADEGGRHHDRQARRLSGHIGGDAHSRTRPRPGHRRQLSASGSRRRRDGWRGDSHHTHKSDTLMFSITAAITEMPSATSTIRRGSDPGICDVGHDVGSVAGRAGSEEIEAVFPTRCTSASKRRISASGEIVGRSRQARTCGGTSVVAQPRSPRRGFARQGRAGVS